MRFQNNFSARNINVLFLAFFVFVFSAQGQTPTPGDEAIRVNTDLIQTNVTVVDKNNRVVENLKREQFEVRVDGKPVALEFFERVGSAQTNQNPAPENKSRPATAANTNPTLQSRRIVFFVDDLHLSLDGLSRTRSTIKHFIEKEMQPRDSVLIVSASGKIGFLQQFTDNQAVLQAAVARLKLVPNPTRDTDSPPMPEFTALRIVNGDRDAASYYVGKILEGFNIKGMRGMNMNAAYKMVENRANNIVYGLVSVSEASLGSLENLMRMLNQFDGRKLIFLSSDGFYLGSKNSGLTDNIRLQRAVNIATRSGSTIYTIDARGLFSIAADATGERPVDPNARLDSGAVGESMLSQDTLFTLAEQTGGRFLKNQNYFDKWIDRMLDENSNYYVLAWNPAGDAPTDKKFKRIEVKVVGRPELTVRMQRGYLANWKESDAKNENNSQNKNAAEKTPAEKTEKPKDAIGGKNLPVVLSLNYLDVPNVGAVVTSSVQIETGAIDYAANQTAAAIDVGGVVLNDEGKQVADFKTGLNVTSGAESAGQSIIYNNRTTLPPGIYQIKVGVRESKTGQAGAAAQWIEIPDLTKKRLTLGSLFLGVTTLQKSDQPEDSQIQFSVDRRFSRPLQFNFMSFIYNAARAANGETNLATKIEIFDASGREIVNTGMRPLSVKIIDDAARIPLTGAIKQPSSLPGSYLLRVTVNDLIAKTSVVQQTIFTVE